MAAVRGNIIAFGLFAAAFALHIVGGATDQGWLFATAVALIGVFAVAFPLVAVAAGRPASRTERLTTLMMGTVLGIVLSTSALWAANGRSMAWWQAPVAIVTVLVVLIAGLKLWPGRGGGTSRPLKERRSS